ncbi:MAG: prenyltransferase/squalene oxidase repeat-containing protein [Solirubrobacteraceae bacterium]
MSWPLASFVIVVGILLAGWFVYERSRPSARMVAVVATLAAVAALGRDAFVALPDVKPITAIALVVGYALGPLSGFTVGAIGMLASNMMLGQGPYTPWQMVAWGLVGLAGALLGRVSSRRMGRFGLALACAVMALVAKEIMNVYTWTLGAAHTPAAFLLIAGQGLPYDITDTVASFLFGFAFGPELARLLGRMRDRMTVEWEPTRLPARPAVAKPPALLILLCVVGVAITAAPPRAGGAVPFRTSGSRPFAPALSTLASSMPAPTLAVRPTHVRARAATSSAIARAVAYLQHAQNSDGGFGGAPGQHSSELYSAWVAIGLAAAGRNPLTFTRDKHSLLSSLRGEAATLEDAGDDERTILALHACGLPASDFPGTSLLAKLVHERSSDGSFGHLVNITAFAIFALRVVGSSADNRVVSDAGRWIASQQDSDGGFGFAGRGGGEDVDDTAAALQAVIDASAQRGGAVVARAVAYLRRAQNPDGGFPQQPGGESNAQSSAWAVQGLDAAGVNVSAVKHGHSRSPLAYLESLMAPNGSVYYSRTSVQTPVWVTAQALTALAAKPFPVAPDFSGG